MNYLNDLSDLSDHSEVHQAEPVRRRPDCTTPNYSVTKATDPYDVFTFSRKNCGIVYADWINKVEYVD